MSQNNIVDLQTDIAGRITIFQHLGITALSIPYFWILQLSRVYTIRLVYGQSGQRKLSLLYRTFLFGIKLENLFVDWP